MARVQVVERPEQGGPRAQRPEPGATVILAIDLSRTKFVYCVRWNGIEQRRLTTPAGLAQVQAVVAQYRDCRLHVVYEACGFGYAVAWWLQAEAIAVSVIAPSRVECAPGARVKTDRRDVGAMARKLEAGQLHGIYIPPRRLHAHRQLGRTYAQCAHERRRAQVRIRSLLLEQGLDSPLPAAGWSAYEQWLRTQRLPASVRQCVRSLRRTRAVADQQAAQLQRALRRLSRRPTYAALSAALSAQPGIGVFSAMRLILELGDMARFPTAGALPHYLGLTPSEYSSGEVVRRGHIMKCGPGAVRALLLQCAWAAVRTGKDPQLRAVFERLEPRVGRKRAIVAVTRRLAIRVRQRWVAAERAMAAPLIPA